MVMPTILPESGEYSQAEKDAMFEALLSKYTDWKDKARTVIANVKDFEGTGEDLRYLVVAKIGEPPTPNVWGALVNLMLKLGYLEKTGERRPMKQVSSHARSTDVYRSVK